MRRSYGLVWFFALVFSTGFLLTAWPGIAMEVADGPFETGEADPSVFSRRPKADCGGVSVLSSLLRLT